MEKIDLGAFRFDGSTLGEIADLRTLDPADKAEMLMSGVDVDGRHIRKGAGDSIGAWVQGNGGLVSPELAGRIEEVGAGCGLLTGMS